MTVPGGDRFFSGHPLSHLLVDCRRAYRADQERQRADHKRGNYHGNKAPQYLETPAQACPSGSIKRTSGKPPERRMVITASGGKTFSSR